MPTLSTIRTNVLEHLEREAGTSSYWESDQVDDVINFIYRTLARQYRNVKEKWSRNSLTTTNTIYKIPEKFLTVDECSWNEKNLSPLSIYEIRNLDREWRTRGGDPTWYCLDYREGFLLLWYFPSSEEEIEIVGSVVPTALTEDETPAYPYSNGLILEPATVSFLLAQEGAGQNLERSKYWYDIFISELSEFSRGRMPYYDHHLRSIDESVKWVRGPKYPSNYPPVNWWTLPKR